VVTAINVLIVWYLVARVGRAQKDFPRSVDFVPFRSTIIMKGKETYGVSVTDLWQRS
jgi:hypothetical protein